MSLPSTTAASTPPSPTEPRLGHPPENVDRVRAVAASAGTADTGTASTGAAGAATVVRGAMQDAHAVVREYYGRTLNGTADLRTSACCPAVSPPAWLRPLLENVHEDVKERFYGCGLPVPPAVEGATVLDLGCGTGRDVYVVAQLVGPRGRALGVDMTAEQLRIARDTETWHARRFGFAEPNTRFFEGRIEDLRAAGITDGSVDVVISNCVVNLSPYKDRVLSEARRVLREGGELLLSDIVADRRLPPEVASDPVLYGECLGGAPYRGDLEDLLREVGFTDVRVVSTAPVTIEDPDLAQRVGAARFASVTYRAFALSGLDRRCEDYGQTVTYRGGIRGAESLFWLDDHHAFEVNRPERVCRNTAAMLSRTRLAPYFHVTPEGPHHLGAFPCDPTVAARVHAGRAAASPPAGSACC
jgi:ubiquinone/menaquinone biosynthesis C-methylase UbiE